MAVGDDAQCIYTWRGADIDQILGFPERHPGTQIFKIETNYRSSPEILKFANGILENRATDENFTKTLNRRSPTRSSCYCSYNRYIPTSQFHSIQSRTTGR
jgi:superfamily I DNA/RNA helicase